MDIYLWRVNSRLCTKMNETNNVYVNAIKGKGNWSLFDGNVVMLGKLRCIIEKSVRKLKVLTIYIQYIYIYKICDNFTPTIPSKV